MEEHLTVCGLPAREEPVINQNIDTGIFILLRRKCKAWVMLSPNHPKSKVYYKSYAERRKEMTRHMVKYNNFIIHPFSLFMMYWEYFISILEIVSMFIFCVSNAYSWAVMTDNGSFLLRRYVDVFTTIDVILRLFFVGYYDSVMNKSVLRRWAIIKHYSFTLFIPDMLSSVNSHFYALYELDDNETNGTILRWSRLLVLTRFFRIPIWFETLECIKKRIGLSVVVSFCLRMLLLISIVLCTCYTLGLVFENAIEATYSTEEAKWQYFNITRFFGVTAKVMLVYIKDIFDYELIAGEIISVWCMVTGFIINVLFLATLMQAISRYLAITKNSERLLSESHQYLIHHQIPSNIRHRFSDYFLFKFQNRFYREEKIHKMLSHVLNDQIMISITKEHVERVEFFKDLHEDVLVSLVRKLKLEIFLTGDIIVKSGDMGDVMYFINYGTVAIYTAAGKELCHLEDGAHFGEIALIFEGPRVATVSAVTPCELFVLSRKDYTESLEPYPAIKAKIEDIARKRMGQK
ncbi:unnamed protein product [Acanthoscelides obtectus]|uniref:Cyclic nucleotide-binding domain-containing protein n=1 Tax=Acanthoscelides obtectus TaxID=200917 RepID=A0A9P0MI11_ACAOB|nr:unnamed protein product [Acanthoscelides obtectus]CAK1673513.1 Potassium/sodium hyperpolarization-activated cyclic nucleotide-gated channel 2 [Acanthoscelides obtectus]